MSLWAWTRLSFHPEPPWSIEMNRQSYKKAAVWLPVVGVVVVGTWLSALSLTAWCGGNSADSSSPKVILPCSKRDLGAVVQGEVLRASFPIKNEGSRRLIVLEAGTSCCGQSAGPRRIVLLPGESKRLSVEVDSRQWYGRMEYSRRYTTNDPSLPRFSLSVSANVGSPEQP